MWVDGWVGRGRDGRVGRERDGWMDCSEAWESFQIFTRDGIEHSIVGAYNYYTIKRIQEKKEKTGWAV
jgi:hypothetical protein